MTIKNICFIIALAFLFYLFIKSPHVEDGYLIGAYSIYVVATVVYIIVNDRLSLGAIKDIYLRKIMRRGLEALCVRRGKILMAASVISVVLHVIKNVPSHVVLNANSFKIFDFDVIGALRFVLLCFLVSSSVLIAYDFYLLSYVSRKLSAHFGHEKEEELYDE